MKEINFAKKVSAYLESVGKVVTIADLAILGVEQSEISTSRALLADNLVKISSLHCLSAVNNV